MLAHINVCSVLWAKHCIILGIITIWVHNFSDKNPETKVTNRMIYILPKLDLLLSPSFFFPSRLYPLLFLKLVQNVLFFMYSTYLIFLWFFFFFWSPILFFFMPVKQLFSPFRFYKPLGGDRYLVLVSLWFCCDFTINNLELIQACCGLQNHFKTIVTQFQSIYVQGDLLLSLYMLKMLP